MALPFKIYFFEERRLVVGCNIQSDSLNYAHDLIFL